MSLERDKDVWTNILCHRILNYLSIYSFIKGMKLHTPQVWTVHDIIFLQRVLYKKDGNMIKLLNT
jgi:hypothetical protein